MLQLRVTIGQGLRPGENVFSDIGQRSKQLRPMLQRWVGFLRKKAAERFDELSGPPLAQSTREKYAHTRTGKITAHGKLRASYGTKLHRFLRTRNGGAHQAEVQRLLRGETNFSSSSRAIERARKAMDKAQAKRPAAPRAGKAGAEGNVQLQVVRERGRLRVRVTSPGYDGSKNVAFPVGKRRAGARFSIPAAALTSVSGGSHYRVAARAVSSSKDARKIDQHRLLGGLRSALAGKLQAAGVILENKVPWSGVHNEGGTAGNGAVIPARTTLEIRPDDEAELAKISLEHLLGK